jgi:chorismate mutase
MTNDDQYYIVKKKAIPEVLQKVVEVKRLLEADKNMTVQEAIDKIKISRSSFYKYKDAIMPFRENTKGRTVTFMIVMDDTPGLLSRVLQLIAEYQANILTILQAIPVNGIASLTISVEVLSGTKELADMVTQMERLVGIHELKLLSRD